MYRKGWQLLLVVLLFLLVIPVLVSAFSATTLVVGRRLNDICPEHDTFLAHALQMVPSQTLAPGWVADYDFDIVATHPITEIAANGLPPAQWCTANFTGCTTSSTATTAEIVATDVFSKVYDDGTWVISTLDISGSTTSMNIGVNDVNYGEHNGLVFNRRRAPTAGTWPQFLVLYANGFTRLKPMGESDASTDDPCFGTSAVLGPYQFTPPLLGGEPHPELHPLLERADIRLTGPTGKPSLMLTGRFVNSSTTTLMRATWLISTTRIDTIETRLNVQQHITGTEKLSFQSVSGNDVLGFASLSSMWADSDTHDADILRISNESGQVYQVHAGGINGIPFGETLPISLTTTYTLSLVTASATDHNVGAPDMHIYLRQALFLMPIYLPIIMKS